MIDIEGWKGESGVEVDFLSKFNLGSEITIREHRKNKRTGEIKEQVTRVPIKRVINIWKIIERGMPEGEWYGYRWLVNKIKNFYGFDVDTEAWNGGRNRAKYYFPFHYYPLKILEAKKFIEYDGRGNIRRLK